MVTINLKCSKHPKYKAKRPPLNCKACKEIFRTVRAEFALERQLERKKSDGSYVYLYRTY